MTFIYRQLISSQKSFDPIVTCSDRLENLDKFPFSEINIKKRNFLRFKKSRYYTKIFGPLKLLAVNPKLSPQQLKHFGNIYKKNNIRLIHSHFGPSGIEILPLAKRMNLPLVVTFHGYDASLLLQNKVYVRNLQGLFNYARIITVSDNMKNDLIKISESSAKFDVIRCGIPVELFKFKERLPLQNKIANGDTIIFLQISNFVEVKGHKYTVQAFRKFLNHYKNARLILAGDGETKISVQDSCRQLGIIDKVIFPGVINEREVNNLMLEADVFLQHSVTLPNGVKEGLPTVLMEAMATGLPVISTFHSAIPELIDNGVNGFLVKERDVEQYSSTMFKLKNLPPNIGLNARKKVVQKFNLDVETEKLFNIYDDMI
jgi:glycosyltransferase involved in cell wall biosynthesis